MLKEIICSKLADKKIVFNKGLNVVVGDDDAANSIGKSSALLLIDFAFGGKSYSANSDITDHIGDHDVYMHFVFDDVDYYFQRNISHPNIIHECDSGYRVIGSMSDNEYKSKLMGLYHIPSDFLTFREVVGLFSRIYGKENYREKEPLYPGHKCNGSERVVYLVKLLNKYQKVQQKYELKEESDRKFTAYKGVVDMKIVASLTPKEYEENKTKIKKLNQQIENIKVQISSDAIDLTAEQLEKIGRLKARLGRIQSEKSLILANIERLQSNLHETEQNFEIDMERVRQMFPYAELKRIEEVNAFHSNLSSILKEEVSAKLRKEERTLDFKSKEEADIIDRIAKVAAETKPESLAVDRLVSTMQTVEQLISGQKSYETLSVLKKEKTDHNRQYKDVMTNVCTEVQQIINNKMEELNCSIMGKGRKVPMINLSPSNYKVFCQNDTGMGTGFRALITFDLAILGLTSLPFLIHDSLIFKQVEDESIDGIVELFNSENEKQLFIAMDKLPSYHENVQKVLKDHQVLKLSKDHPLYGKKWNN